MKNYSRISLKGLSASFIAVVLMVVLENSKYQQNLSFTIGPSYENSHMSSISHDELI